MSEIPKFDNVEELFGLEYSARGLCFLAAKKRDPDVINDFWTNTADDSNEQLFLKCHQPDTKFIGIKFWYDNNLDFEALENGDYAMKCHIPMYLVDCEVANAKLQLLILDKAAGGFNICTTLSDPSFADLATIGRYTQAEIDDETVRKIIPILSSATLVSQKVR